MWVFVFFCVGCLLLVIGVAVDWLVGLLCFCVLFLALGC